MTFPVSLILILFCFFLLKLSPSSYCIYLNLPLQSCFSTEWRFLFIPSSFSLFLLQASCPLHLPKYIFICLFHPVSPRSSSSIPSSFSLSLLQASCPLHLPKYIFICLFHPVSPRSSSSIPSSFSLSLLQASCPLHLPKYIFICLFHPVSPRSSSSIAS